MASLLTTVGQAWLRADPSRWVTADIRLRLAPITETGLDEDLASMVGVGIAASDVAVTGRTGPTLHVEDARLDFECTYPETPPVPAGDELDKAVWYAHVTDDTDAIPIMVSDCVTVVPDGRPIQLSEVMDAAPLLIYLDPPAPPVGEWAPATYSRDGALTSALTSALSSMVPRDASGDPDAEGRMYIVGIGMSNARDYHTVYATLFASDEVYSAEKAAGLRFVFGSKAAATADKWGAGPNHGVWQDTVGKVIDDGGTAAQVLHLDVYMTQSWPADEGVMTQQRVENVVANAKTNFPNLVSLDFHSIAWTGLSVDGRAPLYSVHGDDALLATMTGTLSGVLVDYVQVYSDGDAYNAQHTTTEFASGIRWLEADFKADGVHPSAGIGDVKMARWVLSRWYEDAVKAWMWQA